LIRRRRHLRNHDSAGGLRSGWSGQTRKRQQQK
jgi:hypothetical protein